MDIQVEGRPISQVYNKWYRGQPDSREGSYHCGSLDPDTHLLNVIDCDWTLPFICKHEEKVTATDMATVTAGRPISQVYNKWYRGQPDSREGSYHCGSLDPDTHLLNVIDCDWTLPFICKHEEKVTATDMATVTADVELLKQEVASIKVQVANQTRALEQIAEADANQAASLDRLIETLQRHAANQTAAVERQALAMERFAGPQEQ